MRKKEEQGEEVASQRRRDVCSQENRGEGQWRRRERGKKREGGILCSLKQCYQLENWRTSRQ